MVIWVLVLRLSTAIQFEVLKYAKTTIFCGFTLSSWQRSSEKFGSIYWRLDLKACQVWQLSTVTTVNWFQTYFCQFISAILPFSYPWGSGGSLSVRRSALFFFFFFFLSRRAGMSPFFLCSRLASPQRSGSDRRGPLWEIEDLGTAWKCSDGRNEQQFGLLWCWCWAIGCREGVAGWED